MDGRNLAAAASSGFAAIIYVTDPARWPGFAAFAERTMGESWTESDRQNMRIDGTILNALAESVDPGA